MTEYVYEYTLPVPFTGSPEVVFKALTDPAALTVWFAEQVEIGDVVDGPYRFWGRYTPDIPTKADTAQILTRFEPGEALAFTWQVFGEDSEVTWLLEPDGEENSKVTVRQVFAALPEGVRAKEMIDDLWRLYTGNLCFYLQGERNIFRPDFDDPSPVVRHVIDIAAAPAKVFAALTTPDYIKQWFPAPAPVVEPRVGGKYGFGFSWEKEGETIEAPPCEILEYVENERLAITWPDWRGDASVPDQTVTWILEPLQDGTRLTLEHTGFTRAVDVSDYPFGWVEFIRAIKTVSEGI